MEYRFETEYSPKALEVMAGVIRRTLRRKKNRRIRIFGVVVLVLGILLILLRLKDGFVLSPQLLVTVTAVLVLAAVLIWEDRLNGYVAFKRMLPGMSRNSSVFCEDGYISRTEIGESRWSYDKVQAIAETKDYFVFVFSASHGQIYDKRSLTGGTPEQFREFIERVSGKTILKMKL